MESAIESDMFRKSYGEVFEGDENWNALEVPEGDRYAWDPGSTYVRRPPYFEGMPAEPPAGFEQIEGARALAVLGDSVTTDHISPAGAIKKDSPAGEYLIEHGVEQRDFNSYGSRRGNHEVMMRGTFANIRLRNRLAPGTEGGFTKKDGEVTTIYDGGRWSTPTEGMPLCVLAGKEYGSGSSRDWAAKGPRLLGVRFVIAESYERIHRSNLVGMGVLPLQFPDGESAESLGLTGEETFARAARGGCAQLAGHDRHRRVVRRPGADRHAQRVAVLPRRWDPPLRAARPACLTRVFHQELCFGCGHANLFGLQMELERRADGGVEGRFFVKQDHQGPPGLAHAGLLAAALEEAMGLCADGARAIRLEVELLAPAPVGTFVSLSARLGEGAEPELRLSALACDEEGRALARAAGTYERAG